MREPLCKLLVLSIAAAACLTIGQAYGTEPCPPKALAALATTPSRPNTFSETAAQGSPALHNYTQKYTSPPGLALDSRRIERLKELGVLPKGKWIGLAPRKVGEANSIIGHADGGTYFRDVDQYGDVYGGGSYRELAPFFNIPQYYPLMGVSFVAPRYLTETRKGFPRDKLRVDDMTLLDPLPQRDPFRSYLSGSILRMFTRDTDKPMPPYAAKWDPGGDYTDRMNYFRRMDGTYYLYDFGSNGLLSTKLALRPPAIPKTGDAEFNERWHVTQMMQAIATLPTPEERRAAIDFMVDTVFVIPEIGKRGIGRSLLAEEKAKQDLADEQARFDENSKRWGFRVKSALTGRERPSETGTRSDALVLSHAPKFLILPFHFENVFRATAYSNDLNHPLTRNMQLVPEDLISYTSEALSERIKRFRPELIDFTERLIPGLARHELSAFLELRDLLVESSANP